MWPGYGEIIDLVQTHITHDHNAQIALTSDGQVWFNLIFMLRKIELAILNNELLGTI